MKQSPQIKVRINTIAKELANGKSRAELLGKYGKKWELSRTSFDRYLKDAKIIAGTLSNKANKVAEDTLLQETKEAVKNGLKTVLEYDLKLQEIVFYKKDESDDRTITTSDQLKAIDIYYKRNGHYAPDKVQHSGSIIWEENKTYETKH